MSDVDIRESRVQTFIDGEEVQNGSVSEMASGIDYQLADLCRHMRLGTSRQIRQRYGELRWRNFEQQIRQRKTYQREHMT